MKIVVTNEDGVKIEERSFYDNKQLYTDWVFNDNKIHGTCRSFYKNGNPWSERNYNLGVLHGGYKNWHENGQLYMVGQFKDGKKEGVWLFYDTSGKKTKTIDFNNSGDSTLVS
jgi:antitoxin component YwqK of YwqJK toxin-antitoxin module